MILDAERIVRMLNGQVSDDGMGKGEGGSGKGRQTYVDCESE